MPRPESIPVDANRGAAGLTRWLHALNTRASLILITAHPDDEDGACLAFETRGAGARSRALAQPRRRRPERHVARSFTTHWAVAPGLLPPTAIRRRSVLDSPIDYGFRRSRGSSGQWGHDRVLADVVRVIRHDSPAGDRIGVVGAPTDGTASTRCGQMAQEAFAAAGDQSLSGADPRGTPPGDSAQGYAHVPFFSATPREVRLRHRQIRAGAFLRLHPPDVSSGDARTTVEIAEGDYAPAGAYVFSRLAARAWAFREPE